MGKWPNDIKKFIRVSAEKLRTLFNSSGLDAMAESGEVFEVVFHTNHPSPPLACEPFCTKSQIVHLHRRDNRMLMASFHRYLRTDGTIGASGKRDPKALRSEDVVYLIDDSPAGKPRRQ